MDEHVNILSKNLPNLQKQLNSSLENKMIILFGRCSALFDGRIKSRFSDSDRILIIKQDLSILLHGSSGVKAIQWQLAGAGRVNFEISSEGQLEMETFRPKTSETFIITFKKIFQSLTYKTLEVDDSALIIGNEKDFVEYLIKKPDTIEQGMRIIDSEKEIDFGFVDIWAVDSADNPTVIEVKKANATPSDAHQLKRYVDFFQKKGQKVRGILVAAGFPKKVKSYLKSYNLESCCVMWQEVFPTITRPSKILQSKKLDEFFK